jgi:OOP family OmpA-OmpF porin
MKHSHWMLAAAGVALSLGVAAQSPTVLKGKGITEGALIEALTPRSGSDAGAASRSIRVTRDAPKPQASILITFETNSANLTDSARSSVDVVAKALQADKLASLRFMIEGHADPRGGAEANRKLSQARAENVVAYLVTRHGIARERLTPLGKGDSELMNAARPDAPENRRVTITTVP